MGILGRMFGKQAPKQGWPPPGPITTWPPEPLQDSGNLVAVLFDPPRHPIEVVGEGSHQGSLERIAGGRTIDGPRNRDHFACFLPEPSNVYDPQAVRVVIVGGATVGYLSREDAVAYRPLIDRLAAVGKLVGCRASLSGGWDNGAGDRGSFGVRLFIDTPEGAMKELESTPDQLRPAWEDPEDPKPTWNP